MKKRRCNNCYKNLPVSQFHASQTRRICKQCLAEQYKPSKEQRLDFDSAVLSEDEMNREMSSIKSVSPKGLNALCNFTKAFDDLLLNKPKRYIKVSTAGTYKRVVSKTLRTDNFYSNY